MFILLGLLWASCTTKEGERNRRELVNKWLDKQIIYPSDMFFTNQNGDTIEHDYKSAYKMLVYVDSIGCFSCKLKLPEWNRYIRAVDSIAPNKCAFLFVFATSRRKDIYRNMYLSKFDYPIIIDEQGMFDQFNHFPSNVFYQTFLLDKDNKVLAIGNPVLNPKVKDLYLKIIQGKPVGEEEESSRIETTVSVSSSTLSMGEFPYQEASSGTFTFTNTGKELWVIQDVVTSCGCLTVEYPKEPVRPGGQAVLRVTYRADHPGYFDKTLTVYSNAADSPLRMRVTGSAVE